MEYYEKIYERYDRLGIKNIIMNDVDAWENVDHRKNPENK